MLSGYSGSWGLNLFVLFELEFPLRCSLLSSWGLNLFVLFERAFIQKRRSSVLEDWIYLYYLNSSCTHFWITSVLEDWIYLYYLNHIIQMTQRKRFLRIEFICIIWTKLITVIDKDGSWGLNLFVLFEPIHLTEHNQVRSWGLNLFVLFELTSGLIFWIFPFLRIEFICIIWTAELQDIRVGAFLRIEFICIIWTHITRRLCVRLFLRIEFICIIWTWKWEQVTKELF